MSRSNVKTITYLSSIYFVLRIKIKIQTLTGETFDVEVDQDSTMGQLKVRFQWMNNGTR